MTCVISTPRYTQGIFWAVKTNYNFSHMPMQAAPFKLLPASERVYSDALPRYSLQKDCGLTQLLLPGRLLHLGSKGIAARSDKANGICMLKR